jgi:hypothetical protein
MNDRKNKGKNKTENEVKTPLEYFHKTWKNFHLRIGDKIRTTKKFFTPTFICLNSSGTPVKVRHGVTREEFLLEQMKNQDDFSAIYEWRPMDLLEETEVWAIALIRPAHIAGNCFIKTGEKFTSVDRRHEKIMLQLYEEMQEAQKLIYS